MLTERQFTTTLLPDGTSIDDLVSIDERWVAARVMTDPDLYELELARIFDRVWVFVGHETEIPNHGDFVTRYIGADPVIVARGADGDVHVTLNVCSHRGATVCRVECGNATTFRCPYHAWVYDNTG